MAIESDINLKKQDEEVSQAAVAIKQILAIAEQNKKLATLKLLILSAQQLTDKLPASANSFLEKLEKIQEEITNLINWGKAELKMAKAPDFDYLIMEAYKQLSTNGHPVKDPKISSYLAELYVTSSNFSMLADDNAREKITYNNPALNINKASMQLSYSIANFCNNSLTIPGFKQDINSASENLPPVVNYLSQTAPKPSIKQRIKSRLSGNISQIVDYITRHPRTITYFLKERSEEKRMLDGNYREAILNNPEHIDKLLSTGKPEILNIILNVQNKKSDVLTRIENNLNPGANPEKFAFYYKILMHIYNFDYDYTPDVRVEEIYIKANLSLLNELLAGDKNSLAYKQAPQVLQLEKANAAIVDKYTDKMEILRNVKANLQNLVSKYIDDNPDNPGKVGNIPLAEIIKRASPAKPNIFSNEIRACLQAAEQRKAEQPNPAVSGDTKRSQQSPVKLLLQVLKKGLFGSTRKETNEETAKETPSPAQRKSVR